MGVLFGCVCTWVKLETEPEGGSVFLDGLGNFGVDFDVTTGAVEHSKEPVLE